MDPIEKQERKRAAQLRLLAQRRRAGLLRGRVIAISLVSFALLWSAVFVQMATGNDPVLGGSSSKAAGSHSLTESERDEESGQPVEEELVVAPEEDELAAEPIEEEFIEEEPAPVTTSQS